MRNKYGGVYDMPPGWTKEGCNARVYNLWFQMLRRCYDEEQQNRPQGRTYKDCSVSDRWMIFSNFAEDIQGLPGYEDWKTKRGYCLDKDIRISGNKVYFADGCCFVHHSENTRESSKRNAHILDELHKRQKKKYMITNGEVTMIFESEGDACKFLGVRNCSVSSCRRRGRKCKGFTVSFAKMDEEV